jgi:hypothetical protein
MLNRKKYQYDLCLYQRTLVALTVEKSRAWEVV